MPEPIDPTILKIFLTLLSVAGVWMATLSLPGIILIFGSVLLYAWANGFVEPSSNTLIIAGIITLISFWVDNLATLFGAKKYGASNKGMIGAFLGGILGLLVLGPIGVVIGPLIGAVIVELIVSKDLKNSFRAGFGTFIGYLFGMFLKLIITIIMFIWALTVIW